MSKHYDNWERLVEAVLRRDHDRQLALIHSRDHSSNGSSCSCSCCHRSSTTASQFDHDLSVDLRERGDQLPMDYSGLTPLHHNESNQNSIREEDRWLREEKRWLREEQRWLREESRWNAERQAFLQEINRLKLRIQELEWLNSVQGGSANIAKLLQVLKEGDLWNNLNRTDDSGANVVPLMVGAPKKEEEVFVKEVICIPETKEMVQSMATLRRGSEGDEVGAMQKLGFYSGEEDMKYSSFQSGTERPVKTWQATLGARDGTKTADLLERSFGSCASRLTLTNNEQCKSTDSEKRSSTGAPVNCITDINEVVITAEDVTESQHRVFLGENQWEEPSRHYGGSKRTTAKSTSENATTNCFSCRGEGHLLCMECKRSGEPHVRGFY